MAIFNPQVNSSGLDISNYNGNTIQLPIGRNTKIIMTHKDFRCLYYLIIQFVILTPLLSYNLLVLSFQEHSIQIYTTTIIDVVSSMLCVYALFALMTAAYSILQQHKIHHKFWCIKLLVMIMIFPNLIITFIKGFFPPNMAHAPTTTITPVPTDSPITSAPTGSPTTTITPTTESPTHSPITSIRTTESPTRSPTAPITSAPTAHTHAPTTPITSAPTPSCYTVYNNPCWKYKDNSAADYAYFPSCTSCCHFIQCNTNGDGFDMMCAPGTWWDPNTPHSNGCVANYNKCFDSGKDGYGRDFTCTTYL